MESLKDWLWERYRGGRPLDGTWTVIGSRKSIAPFPIGVMRDEFLLIQDGRIAEWVDSNLCIVKEG